MKTPPDTTEVRGQFAPAHGSASSELEPAAESGMEREAGAEPVRYSVFPNGTSHMIWRDANCDRCWKSRVNEKTGKSRCAIEYAIALGSATDGTFLADGSRTPEHAARLAKRLGWGGVSYLETDCPEREEKRPKYPRHARALDTLPLFSVGAGEETANGTREKTQNDLSSATAEGEANA